MTVKHGVVIRCVPLLSICVVALSCLALLVQQIIRRMGAFRKLSPKPEYVRGEGAPRLDRPVLPHGCSSIPYPYPTDAEMRALFQGTNSRRIVEPVIRQMNYIKHNYKRMFSNKADFTARTAVLQYYMKSGWCSES